MHVLFLLLAVAITRQQVSPSFSTRLSKCFYKSRPKHRSDHWVTPYTRLASGKYQQLLATVQELTSQLVEKLACFVGVLFSRQRPQYLLDGVVYFKVVLSPSLPTWSHFERSVHTFYMFWKLHSDITVLYSAARQWFSPVRCSLYFRVIT